MRRTGWASRAGAGAALIVVLAGCASGAAATPTAATPTAASTVPSASSGGPPSMAASGGAAATASGSPATADVATSPPAATADVATSPPAATADVATSPPAATADPIDATARRWLAAAEAKDLSAMKALFAPDGVFEDAALGEKFGGGPQAEIMGWAPVLATLISVKDPKVLALGDGVAVVTFTLYGPTPAHETAIDVPILGVLQVTDGRITRETLYYSATLAYGP